MASTLVARLRNLPQNAEVAVENSILAIRETVSRLEDSIAALEKQSSYSQLARVYTQLRRTELNTELRKASEPSNRDFEEVAQAHQIHSRIEDEKLPQQNAGSILELISTHRIQAQASDQNLDKFYFQDLIKRFRDSEKGGTGHSLLLTAEISTHLVDLFYEQLKGVFNQFDENTLKSRISDEIDNFFKSPENSAYSDNEAIINLFIRITYQIYHSLSVQNQNLARAFLSTIESFKSEFSESSSSITKEALNLLRLRKFALLLQGDLGKQLASTTVDDSSKGMIVSWLAALQKESSLQPALGQALQKSIFLADEKNNLDDAISIFKELDDRASLPESVKTALETPTIAPLKTAFETLKTSLPAVRSVQEAQNNLRDFKLAYLESLVADLELALRLYKEASNNRAGFSLFHGTQGTERATALIKSIKDKQTSVDLDGACKKMVSFLEENTYAVRDTSFKTYFLMVVNDPRFCLPSLSENIADTESLKERTELANSCRNANDFQSGLKEVTSTQANICQSRLFNSPRREAMRGIADQFRQQTTRGAPGRTGS